jgi:magnesium transporter
MGASNSPVGGDESRYAGRISIGALVKTAPIFSSDVRISEVKSELGKGSFESIEIVIAAKDDGRFAGVATTKDVLSARDDTRLIDVLRSHWPVVSDRTIGEHAVHSALCAHVSVLPVVAKGGKPIGCLPALSLIEILGREHRQDIHRLVGITHGQTEARHALDDPPLRRVTRRLPWLIIGLILSSAAAFLMANFEEAMQGRIMLAFFVPSLVYIADAIGTQTETIAVRWLSLRDPSPAIRVVAGEFVTGGLIGGALGLIAFLGVAAYNGDAVFAFGIGLTIAAAGALASFLGLVLPWLLSTFRIDPAFGSGPVATVVQDVLTILLYFTIMSVVLS